MLGCPNKFEYKKMIEVIQEATAAPSPMEKRMNLTLSFILILSCDCLLYILYDSKPFNFMKEQYETRVIALIFLKAKTLYFFSATIKIIPFRHSFFKSLKFSVFKMPSRNFASIFVCSVVRIGDAHLISILSFLI